LQQKQNEDKIRTSDPNKANQVERLGMGVSKKGGFSHSMITEIATISQEEPHSTHSGGNSRTSNNTSRSKSNFEDEFEFITVGNSGN
jgi:ADP-ribosylation factor GTPase-activating protein 2/3